MNHRPSVGGEDGIISKGGRTLHAASDAEVNRVSSSHLVGSSYEDEEKADLCCRRCSRRRCKKPHFINGLCEMHHYLSQIVRAKKDIREAKVRLEIAQRSLKLVSTGGKKRNES